MANVCRAAHSCRSIGPRHWCTRTKWSSQKVLDKGGQPGTITRVMAGSCSSVPVCYCHCHLVIVIVVVFVVVLANLREDTVCTGPRSQHGVISSCLKIIDSHDCPGCCFDRSLPHQDRRYTRIHTPNQSNNTLVVASKITWVRHQNGNNVSKRQPARGGGDL